MGKLTRQERELTKHIIAIMSKKRMYDTQIIAEIKRQINKELSRISLYHLRQQIKKDSYEWYMKLRSNQYEYLHEFKERINEVLWLQKKHHEIIESNKNNPTVQQTSLADKMASYG